ncbi:VanZ family protein [Paenibacillus methanolicus]|uniref:Glycopeptide antibiotics resistance protein n=1 Tax=Paenibacillus methanolicus TaxID=582686 RepID=A0A5S5CK09_9BACL|nr:VanZ family protein [Paenibacillus methanolicus]TYP79343.1 glycopeptide antibiotics resistance protein [Paenibacillus methanolicus]
MNKRERIFLYGVFIGYIILLIKVFFLSRVSISELFDSQRTIVRSINLIPFYSISEFLSGSSENLRRFASANVVGNIMIFIPLGGYLSLFKNKARAVINLRIIVLASLIVEIIQGILGIGAADIDDLILNGLGGWLGILGYQTLRFIVRDEKKVHTAITVLSAIIVLPALYYYLFMIKMRF